MATNTTKLLENTYIPKTKRFRTYVRNAIKVNRLQIWRLHTHIICLTWCLNHSSKTNKGVTSELKSYVAIYGKNGLGYKAYLIGYMCRLSKITSPYPSGIALQYPNKYDKSWQVFCNHYLQSNLLETIGFIFEWIYFGDIFTNLTNFPY